MSQDSFPRPVVARRAAAALTAVLLGALVLGGFVLSSRTSRAGGDGAPTSPRPGTQPVTGAAAPTPSLDATASVTPQDPVPYPEGADLPEPPVAEGNEFLIDMERWERQVNARRPQVVEFRKLANKALRSQEENARLRELLSDPRMLATAVEDLVGRKETQLDRDRQLQRNYQVDVLNAAMSWKENPAREAAVQAAMRAVAFDNLDPSLPKDLRKSFAGDKVELYAVLLRGDPARTEELRRAARGTRLEPLMRYGNLWGNYLLTQTERAQLPLPSVTDDAQ
ncbi:hypothetical protein [Archangium violaceum]|uniref:hypothetical protein n=1 Tax=Archangium violaceum TaxID=83451 RepID=UPI0036DC30E2